MSEHNQPNESVHTTGPSNFGLAAWGVAAIVLVFAVIFGLRALTSARTNDSPAESAEMAAEDNTEERALARIRARSAKERAESVLAAITTLEEHIAAWNSEILPLATNERGRLLAANPKHVDAYSSFIRQKRASNADADRFRRDAKDLAGVPVTAIANDDKNYEPSKAWSDALSAIEKEVRAAVDSYANARTKIDAMFVEAEQAAKIVAAKEDTNPLPTPLTDTATSAPASPPSLTDAVNEQDREEAAEAARKTEEARQGNEERNRTTKATLTALQGHWESQELSVGDYGFEIEGRTGKATRTNAPKAFRVGDTILRIVRVRGEEFQYVGGHDFEATQIFTNGKWYEILGTLSGSTLDIAVVDKKPTSTPTWRMTRKDAAEPLSEAVKRREDEKASEAAAKNAADEEHQRTVDIACAKLFSDPREIGRYFGSVMKSGATSTWLVMPQVSVPKYLTDENKFLAANAWLVGVWHLNDDNIPWENREVAEWKSSWRNTRAGEIVLSRDKEIREKHGVTLYEALQYAWNTPVVRNTEFLTADGLDAAIRDLERKKPLSRSREGKQLAALRHVKQNPPRGGTPQAKKADGPTDPVEESPPDESNEVARRREKDAACGKFWEDATAVKHYFDSITKTGATRSWTVWPQKLCKDRAESYERFYARYTYNSALDRNEAGLPTTSEELREWDKTWRETPAGKRTLALDKEIETKHGVTLFDAFKYAWETPALRNREFLTSSGLDAAIRDLEQLKPTKNSPEGKRLAALKEVRSRP